MTLHTLRLTLTAFILANAATAVLAQAQPGTDGLLRDKAGAALYTFAKDSAGESRCHDGCAVAWPPFMAADGAKASATLTLHARPGGSLQWGWKGQPLYYFAGDTQPGDAKGDGQGGTWHAVRQAAAGRAAAPARTPAAEPPTY